MDVGPTRHQGMPEAPGTPWWVVEPMGSFSTNIRLCKYSKIPKTIGESTKYFSAAASSSTTRSDLEAFYGTLLEGATITEGFFIILVAPPMMRE